MKWKYCQSWSWTSKMNLLFFRRVILACRRAHFSEIIERSKILLGERKNFGAKTEERKSNTKLSIAVKTGTQAWCWGIERRKGNVTNIFLHYHLFSRLYRISFNVKHASIFDRVAGGRKEMKKNRSVKRNLKIEKPCNFPFKCGCVDSSTRDVEVCCA